MQQSDNLQSPSLVLIRPPWSRRGTSDSGSEQIVWRR